MKLLHDDEHVADLVTMIHRRSLLIQSKLSHGYHCILLCWVAGYSRGHRMLKYVSKLKDVWSKLFPPTLKSVPWDPSQVHCRLNDCSQHEIRFSNSGATNKATVPNISTYEFINLKVYTNKPHKPWTKSIQTTRVSSKALHCHPMLRNT